MVTNLILSIIVPCYNVERYLSKCIESLVHQDISLLSYEIIIVNDGSTDRTQNIADNFAREYFNISVIYQNNKGIGASRNLGIRMAKGKFLMFVDADDYLENNVLSLLIEKIELNKLDVLRFNHKTIDENFIELPKRKNSTFSIKWDERITNGEVFLTKKMGWGCYVWLYVLNRDFIKINNLYFNENIIFEDVEWLVRVLLQSERVMSLNKKIYYYLNRMGSVTQSLTIENKNRTISDKIFIIYFLKNLSRTTNSKNVSLWCEGMISLTFMGILSFIENELPERKLEIINILNNQRFLPLKSYHFTLKQKRDLLIINYNPLLYCFLKRRK